MNPNDKTTQKGDNDEHHLLISLDLLLVVPTPKPRTTIYVEPELYQALQRRAKDERRSISNLCNILIEDAMAIWLETNPEPEESASTPKKSTAALSKAKPTAAAKAKRKPPSRS